MFVIIAKLEADKEMAYLMHTINKAYLMHTTNKDSFTHMTNASAGTTVMSTSYSEVTTVSNGNKDDTSTIAIAVGISVAVVLVVVVVVLVVFLRKRNSTPASPTKKNENLKESKDDKDRYIRSPRKPVINDVYETAEIDNANESTQDYYNINQDTEEQYYVNLSTHNKNHQKQPTTGKSKVQDSAEEDIYETQLPTAEEIYSTRISCAQTNDEDEIYVNHSAVKKFNKRH